MLARSASMSRMVADLLVGVSPETVAAAVLQEEQAPTPVFHRFGPGIYIREVHAKAGSFAVGHRHKKRCVNQVIAGKVELFSDDGTSRIIEAPAYFVSEPDQKVGIILEDMVWQNIIATDETDIEKIEAEFFEASPSKAQALAKLQSESESSAQADREDFLLAIKELGCTPEQVWDESVISSDRISFPPGSWSLRVSASPIHGVGLFATHGFRSGDFICPALIDGKRTPAGRYVNHSANPNCRFEVSAGGINLVASRDIVGCLGGGIGEELTVCYRQARRLRNHSLTNRGDSCQQ